MKKPRRRAERAVPSVVLALLATPLLLAQSAAAPPEMPRKPYIVLLAKAPALRYEGESPQLNKASPAAGERFDVEAEPVQRYVEQLRAGRAQIEAEVPEALITHRYELALNGFAAWLTEAEVTKLAATAGVQSIVADEPVPMDTVTTPRFLGISEPGGVWSSLDAAGRRLRGEDVIIAHVDGGVWPENPSFSDRVGANGRPVPSHQPGTVVYEPLPVGRWNGVCQGGIGFKSTSCNNKLIGARYFNDTWKAAAALGVVRTWSGEYLDSPRDPTGHGSHTLSTSGGNENVEVTINGSQFTISGVAPRARVAAYKSCYTPADANDNPQPGTCFPSDSAAAIDQAVADGVDVINFSVGGSGTLVNDAVETAFANASFAGVFVATSAGNGNVVPANAPTVAHVSPWVTTVGNSTHDRFTVASVRLGNGFSASGPSFQTRGLDSRELILATDAGTRPYADLSDADKLALARCYGAADRTALGGSAAAALDPAKVRNRIVVCYRGGNVLVNKAQEVRDRGGAGMLLLNLPAGLLAAPLNAASANTVFNIAFVVPSVHLAAEAAAEIVGYAARSGATASFAAAAQISPSPPAPVMNDSSSRGPNRGDPNVLKPDIAAPGTDIIAAYANTSITRAQRLQIIAGTLTPDPGADMISGTSMASPHVAGAAALLRQANPTWSPHAIKSALMTSARPSLRLASGAADTNRWGYGAGHLDPNAALATRVVYDQSAFDLLQYYFGTIGGRSLNLPSLTHANVIGVGRLVRTLSNKGDAPVRLTAAASLPGFEVSVTPSTLTIPAGGSASYAVQLRRSGARSEQWSFGELRWAGDATQTLASPLTAKAQDLGVPPLISDTRADGGRIVPIATGYNGALHVSGFGLTPAGVLSGRIATDQRLCAPLTVPSDAKILRAQLFNSETQGGAASDLDLVVLRGTTQVGASGGPDSDELVSITNPAAGSYQICVDGFAPVNGNAAFRLSIWLLGPSNPGSLRTIAARNVTLGGVTAIGVAWSVAPNARHLGLVEFRNNPSAAPIAATTVFVDAVRAPAAPAAAQAVIQRAKPLR